MDLVDLPLCGGSWRWIGPQSSGAGWPPWWRPAAGAASPRMSARSGEAGWGEDPAWILSWRRPGALLCSNLWRISRIWKDSSWSVDDKLKQRSWRINHFYQIFGFMKISFFGNLKKGLLWFPWWCQGGHLDWHILQLLFIATLNSSQLYNKI